LNFLLAATLAVTGFVSPVAAAPIHTTYLWHMHQPIYWPERSTWNGLTYEYAYETITLGHSQNDVFDIFNKDDRVRDYQDYPKIAIQSVLDLADAGAQVSFAGGLIQNIQSLAQNGWNGGRYASNWYQAYRDAQGWTTSGGRPRLEPVVVAFHHPVGPLVDDAVFRRMLQTQKSIMPEAWAAASLSKGFFPAETCFSERLIPALVDEGIEWSLVADVHISRACADYPYNANRDNCDPPNPADQINPAQGFYTSQNISRGVTVKIPVPFGFRPHRAQYIDPSTGETASLVVVPVANAMSWNEGYGSYGTGEIDAIASYNDPTKPMLVVLGHDGDNAWSGGFSYYNENVTQFSHAAASQGYEPTTVAEFLADHAVDPSDIVHVEDGGWVNADGDFGSPQFINWNWPLVNSSGQFDIPGGWAEDERNWAVLTAAVNRVLTAEGIAGAPDVSRIVEPTLSGATDLERAWHFLLVGHESGYMYYGKSLDMELKPTLAANRAAEHADLVIATGADTTAPTIWIPQRLPWNPGGYGGGSLWGYPGGEGAPMAQDFWVWTFIHDVSGVESARLLYRIDNDGMNPLVSTDNETYAGGFEVGAWQSLAMTRRPFPRDNVFGDPEIDFTVLPTYIAEQWHAQVTDLDSVLVDYYVEAVDSTGRIRRSPIQHVWVGTGGGGSTPSNPAVSWEPESPQAGGTLTIHYDPVAGALADDTDPVYIHIGHSGWAGVITPDPTMTWSVVDTAFQYVYSIPSAATSVEFVFTDGAGGWDSNGGSDWHVPVSGSTSPPFTMDGQIDPGAVLLTDCAGDELHGSYDGQYLYLAAPPVSATGGLDHFFVVARGDGPGTRAAMWSKSGTVPEFDLFLGNEDSNGWFGWFDDSESNITGGVGSASGVVLEGYVDCQALWGTAPSEVKIAWVAYGSADAGALSRQTPCGNADGDLAWSELFSLSAATVDVPFPGPLRGLRLDLLSSNPTDGHISAVLDAPGGETITVQLLDVRGRIVDRLYRGVPGGPITLRWRASAELSSGIYFLVATGEGRIKTQRIALLR
jgi:hypothetical protein